MLTKKQKMLAGICTPLAALGAVGTVASCSNGGKITPKTSTGDYKITFVTDGESRFIDDEGANQYVYHGTTLDRVNKPKAQSLRNNYEFAGWVDTATGKEVPGNYKINKNTQLKAAFADVSTGDYAMITFKAKPGEKAKGVTLHGNVSVAVKKGYLFLMTNRPTAEYSDNYFRCWQYYDSVTGEYVDMTESTTITDDITLYPSFTEAVTVTWNPGDGGMLVRGQPTTKLSAGTIFDKFNQPQLVNSDLNKKFSFWTLDPEATETSPRIDAKYVINADTTVYAVWTDAGREKSADMHIINFGQNDTEGQPKAVFAPSNTTTFAISTDPENPVEWTDIVKPDVSTEDNNYELQNWQWYGKVGDEAESSWHDVPDKKPAEGSEEWAVWEALTTELNQGYSETTTGTSSIRPVMKSSISGVTISGSSQVLPESQTTYTAAVSGTDVNPSVQQNVSWSIVDEKGHEPSPDDVTFKSGVLTVKSLTTSKTYTIKAWSTDDPTQFAEKTVTVVMPYVNSQRIWYHNGTQWFSMAQKDGLCVETQITATALNSSYGQTEQVWARNTPFEYNLYVGRQLKKIYDQFGYKWEGFNGTIDFGDNNIEVIGDSFLEGATSFNQALDLSKIVSVGSNFLYGATSFGAPGTETGHEYDALISFTNKTAGRTVSPLVSIGNNFLGMCENNTRKIVLPTDNDISIGDGFMYNNWYFNQDITLPANLIAVEDFFMYGCDSFTSTITAECDPNIFANKVYSFAASSGYAYIYLTGFKVAGTNATSFKAKFPTRFGDFSYRTIKEGSTPVTDKPEEAKYVAAVRKITGSSNGIDTTLNYTVDYDGGKGGGKIYVSGNDTAERGRSSVIVNIPSGASASDVTFYNLPTSGTYINSAISYVYDGSNARLEPLAACGEWYDSLSINGLIGKLLTYTSYETQLLWNSTDSYWYSLDKDGNESFRVYYDATNEVITKFVCSSLSKLGTLTFYNYGKTAIPESKPVQITNTKVITNVSGTDTYAIESGTSALSVNYASMNNVDLMFKLSNLAKLPTDKSCPKGFNFVAADKNATTWGSRTDCFGAKDGTGYIIGSNGKIKARIAYDGGGGSESYSYYGFAITWEEGCSLDATDTVILNLSIGDKSTMDWTAFGARLEINDLKPE